MNRPDIFDLLPEGQRGFTKEEAEGYEKVIDDLFAGPEEASNGSEAARLVVSRIRHMGNPCMLVCDGKCSKAWGINARPEEQAGEDIDDFFYYADGELGEAPKDPGTYEGGHAKPSDYSDPNRHNKWCSRECERSTIHEPGEEGKLPDFSERRYNQPWKHQEPST